MKPKLCVCVIVVLYALTFSSNCQQDEADVNVKIIPANHFRMQKSDVSRLKQELEHNMKKKVALLEEQWTANEKLRERSAGVWNLRGSPMITPTSYGGPQVPQPWFLTSTANSKSEEEDQSENEKIADKLAKQLFLVNQAITQLKTTIDDSKKNLGNPIVKEVKTIVHSPTRTDMVAPRFEESGDNLTSPIEANSKRVLGSDKNDTNSSGNRFLEQVYQRSPLEDKNSALSAANKFFGDIFEEKEFKDMSEKLVNNQSLTELETKENVQEYRKENENGVKNLLNLMNTQKIKPESSYIEEGMKQYQTMATKTFSDYLNKQKKESEEYKFSEKDDQNNFQNGPVTKEIDPSVQALLRAQNSKKEKPKAQENGPAPRLPQANGALAGYSYGNPSPY